ncbi:MAG: TM2 domain-containing protein [Acholeplasmataceae bacterium]
MKKYCPNCGFQVQETDKTCSYCGKTLVVEATFNSSKSIDSEKKVIILLLLFIFLPGAHYVYVRKFELAILYVVSLGGLGIWWFIDLVKIITNQFTDQHGNVIEL